MTEERVTITISKRNWRRITKKKINLDLKSNDAVIDHLFKNERKD